VNRIANQVPSWIFVLLIVLIGIRGAQLVVDLAGASTVVARSSSPGAPSAMRKVVDIPSILRANLFGQSPTAAGTDAPVTTMNLKLVLVFAANDEKLGLAAIGSGTEEVKVYKVGDAVPGGARLHAVYVDRVLLDRGGSIEALLVPPRSGAAQGPATALPVASAGVSMERVQQIILDNPGLINQVMSRQAVFQDGRLAGVRVNPGPNTQAFNRLGLRPNDLVTAINGMPLDDQSRANEVFNTLNGASQARVTVNRNGRETELNLNLAEIANEAERLAEAPPRTEPDPGPDSTR
jgi:general secretion pathway protein C